MWILPAVSRSNQIQWTSWECEQSNTPSRKPQWPNTVNSWECSQRVLQHCNASCVKEPQLNQKANFHHRMLCWHCICYGSKWCLRQHSCCCPILWLRNVTCDYVALIPRFAPSLSVLDRYWTTNMETTAFTVQLWLDHSNSRHKTHNK